jgi:membrane protease YdiL (CAAX protease family)
MPEATPVTARPISAGPECVTTPAARPAGPSRLDALIDLCWIAFPTVLWVVCVEPFLVALLVNRPPAEAGEVVAIPYAVLVAQMVVRLALVGGLGYWRLSARRQGFAEIGLTGRNAVGELAIGFPAALVLFGLSMSVGIWLVICWPDLLVDIYRSRKEGLAVFPVMAPWQWVLLPVLAAAVEELFFRGLIQQRLTVIFRGPLPAVIIQAAIFASGHFYEGAAAVLGIFYLGIALGWLTWWRGSLLPAIAGHALFNIVQFALLESVFRPYL